ncbi:MAG: hypothetical protein RSA24_03735 [Clostridia bacterium]
MENETKKIYEQTIQGKLAFVRDCLSPLVANIGCGWDGARYSYSGDTEIIQLISEEDNVYSHPIQVTGDSLLALVVDVIKHI